MKITAALLAMFALSLPLHGYLTKEDNPQLTKLLAEADDEAAELASDADDTQALVQSDQTWLNHALLLAKVKGHVDALTLIINKLSKARNSGSELQREAIEQMQPLVNELSANTTAAIDYLNRNKNRPVSDAYFRYLTKNAETAHQLSSMISSLVDYEKSMSEIEKLRSSLGASGT